MHEESTDRLQISIFGLWRNAEKYIEKTLAQLEALETRYDLSYYFYENDSTDNTSSILEKWMKSRQGKFSSNNLGDDLFTNKDVGERLIQRMKKMAYYRNLMLQLGLDDKVNTEWSLVLDTDIEFDANIIDDYLKYHYKGVVMMTPHIEQTVKCHICDPPCNKLSYYDSWALRTKESPCRSVTFGCNPFWEKDNRDKYKKGETVEVECAFGGIALIKTKSLTQSKWDTTGDCEHVMFAEGIRKTGKIIVCPKVKVYTLVEGVEVDPAHTEFQRARINDAWAHKAALFQEQSLRAKAAEAYLKQWS